MRDSDFLIEFCAILGVSFVCDVDRVQNTRFHFLLFKMLSVLRGRLSNFIPFFFSVQFTVLFLLGKKKTALFAIGPHEMKVSLAPYAKVGSLASQRCSFTQTFMRFWSTWATHCTGRREQVCACVCMRVCVVLYERVTQEFTSSKIFIRTRDRRQKCLHIRVRS